MLSKAYQIDQTAQQIFKTFFPTNKWIIREEKPDFYIDYTIETAKESNPAGDRFYVQLKGTEVPKFRKTYLSFNLKTEHLVYYLDCVKQPVYLIEIDVKQKKGYYLFLQKWLATLNDSEWRKQETFTVKIPLNNDLSRLSFFQDDLCNSLLYMRDKWSTSPENAIMYQKQTLEALDPRLNLDFSYNKGEHIIISAKEHVQFNFSVSDKEEVRNGLRDHIEKGTHLRINTEDIIDVEGSCLLKTIIKDKPGFLEIGPNIQEANIRICSKTENKKRIIINTIKGIIRSGTKLAHFEGNFGNELFSLQIDIDRIMQIMTVNFKSDISYWSGMPVHRLPNFDEMLSFYSAINDKNELEFKCYVKSFIVFNQKNSSDLSPGLY